MFNNTVSPRTPHSTTVATISFDALVSAYLVHFRARAFVPCFTNAADAVYAANAATINGGHYVIHPSVHMAQQFELLDAGAVNVA